MSDVPSPSVGKQSPVETLAKHVQCTICLETYRDPKALACLHTYCRECVQRLVLQQHRDQRVECPQCRSLVPVPGNDANNLQTMFFINSLIEFYNTLKKAESNEIACQSCSSVQAIAITFCQNCEMFICSECVNAHKKMKAFADHKTVPLSEMKQGSVLHLPTKKLPAFTCQKQGHGGELLKLYCFNCQQIICRDCTLIDHAGHKFDFVSSVVAAFKVEVQASLVPLRETHCRVSVAVDKVEGATTEITNQEATVTETIKQSFHQLRTILDDHEKSLLQKAREMSQKKRDTLSEQRESLQLAQATLESLVGFTERMAESASDEEFVSMKQQLSSRFQQLTEKYKQIKLNPAEVANVGVVLPSAENLSMFCQNQMYISTLDPSKCTVHGLKKANETNKETKLIVHGVDKHGHTCPYIPESVITAELKSVATGFLTPVRVLRKDPSSFELSYTPTTRGRHQLSIRVGDVEIGPFQVFVHHPPTQLGTPVRVIEGVERPWGLDFSSQGGLCVTECQLGQFIVLDGNGKRVKTTCTGSMSCCRGITIDHKSNMFVASDHKVQKFSNEGNLLKTVGSDSVGTGQGQFNVPCGIRCHNNQLYVCDTYNDRIQVFDLDLNFVRSFGSKGDAPGQFRKPYDIDFDSRGNAYITDFRKHQIHMFTETGEYLHQFSREGQRNGELKHPTGVNVFNDHVYVSEYGNNRVSVFRTSGEFVASFGKKGSGSRGELLNPYGIAVDQDGFIHVCDISNNCVHVF